MGVSTDGQLCLGVSLEEGCELPWDEEDGPEEWWMEVNGYEPPCQPYTEEGEYAEGFHEADPRVNEYHDHKRQWLDANPMPFVDVIHCSYDYPMHIIAVPGTVQTNSRGYPTEITRTHLDVEDEQLADYLAFMMVHFPGHERPRWWLSSLMG